MSNISNASSQNQEQNVYSPSFFGNEAADNQVDVGYFAQEYMEGSFSNDGKLSTNQFSKIVWFNLCESGPQKLLNDVYFKNLQIIYGSNLFNCTALEDAIQFIQKQQMQDHEIQEMLVNRTQDKNLPFFLFICTHKSFPSFVAQISKMKHVYHKCILFRDPKNNRHDQVYCQIKQIYDCIKVLEKLSTELAKNYQARPFRFYEESNINISKEVKQMVFPGECQDSEEQQNKRLILVKHLQKTVVPEIMNMQAYIFIDNMKFFVVVTHKQELSFQCSNEYFSLVTQAQVEEFFRNDDEIDRVVLISTQLERLVGLVKKQDKIISWIRCNWGKEVLNQEDALIYKQKKDKYVQRIDGIEKNIIEVTTIKQLDAEITSIQEKLEQTELSTYQ